MASGWGGTGKPSPALQIPWILHFDHKSFIVLMCFPVSLRCHFVGQSQIRLQLLQTLIVVIIFFREAGLKLSALGRIIFLQCDKYDGL
jgi:hypothetical protein